MRLPFLSSVMESVFGEIQEHAEKVKECAWIFQQAFECYMDAHCESFSEHMAEVVRIETEADEIKLRIASHLPLNVLMPVNKAFLLEYIQVQDSALNAVVRALEWLSYRDRKFVPPHFHEDFLLLVDAVMDPFEELVKMATEAGKYCKRFSEIYWHRIGDIVRNILQQYHEAENIEEKIKRKAFDSISDPITLYHVVRLAESIGTVSACTRHTGTMMAALLAR